MAEPQKASPEMLLRLQPCLVAEFLVNDNGYTPAAAAAAGRCSRAIEVVQWVQCCTERGDMRDDGAARGTKRLATPEHALDLGNALVEDKVGRAVERVTVHLDRQPPGSSPELSPVENFWKAGMVAATYGTDNLILQRADEVLEGWPGRRPDWAPVERCGL